MSWSGSSSRTVTSPPTAGASNEVTRKSVPSTAAAPSSGSSAGALHGVLLGREHRHDQAPGRLLLLVDQPPLDGRHGRQAAGLEPPDVLELELHVPRALLLGQHVEPSLDRPVVLLFDGVGEQLIAPDPPRHLGRLRLQLAHDLLRDGLRLREPSVGLAALRGDDQLEQDHRHRDHRDHDDDHEE